MTSKELLGRFGLKPKKVKKVDPFLLEIFNAFCSQS
jgi:hypothetical protein